MLIQNEVTAHQPHLPSSPGKAATCFPCVTLRPQGPAGWQSCGLIGQGFPPCQVPAPLPRVGLTASMQPRLEWSWMVLFPPTAPLPRLGTALSACRQGQSEPAPNAALGHVSTAALAAQLRSPLGSFLRLCHAQHRASNTGCVIQVVFARQQPAASDTSGCNFSPC